MIIIPIYLLSGTAKIGNVFEIWKREVELVDWVD